MLLIHYIIISFLSYSQYLFIYLLLLELLAGGTEFPSWPLPPRKTDLQDAEDGSCEITDAAIA